MTDNAESLTKLVGTNILRRRKALGLTQEELAERVGIGQQSLSRMEQGRMAPKFERLQYFADALVCPVTELFRMQEDEDRTIAERLADVLHGVEEKKRNFVVEHVFNLVHILK